MDYRWLHRRFLRLTESNAPHVRLAVSVDFLTETGMTYCRSESFYKRVGLDKNSENQDDRTAFFAAARIFVDII